MGVDITVLVVDWDHLMGIAPDDRADALQDAAYPDDDRVVHAGWVWFEPGPSWLGRFEFAGISGSYKSHFCAADGWDHARRGVGREPRALLDDFLGALIWWGPEIETDTEQVEAGVFPPDDPVLRSGPLIAWGPAETARLSRRWREIVPVLPRVREPYDRLAASPGGRIEGFDDFAGLLSGWGEVVGEAERRGWGIVGLPI
ncbi:hypothetical protein ACFV4G_07360 [Kitasatospora sp. NPDC059747]|uniref:hypothetical protein n=1 Tax=Kitasatospora sp. NPDC059747 TaxID=3346930 RepID=UPI0036623450